MKTGYATFKNASAETLAACLALLDRKGSDYSPGDYAFDNFARMARIVEAMELDLKNPAHIALYHIVGKCLRLVKIGTRLASNESAADSCQDIINYTLLYDGIHKEQVQSDEDVKK